jgi:hypothetical protein
MPDAGERALLAELAQHPAWAVLKRTVEERRLRDMNRLAAELYAKGETTQNVDYVRGLHQGAAWVLTQADNAFSTVSEERDT